MIQDEKFMTRWLYLLFSDNAVAFIWADLAHIHCFSFFPFAFPSGIEPGACCSFWFLLWRGSNRAQQSITWNLENWTLAHNRDFKYSSACFSIILTKETRFHLSTFENMMLVFSHMHIHTMHDNWGHAPYSHCASSITCTGDSRTCGRCKVT